MKPCFTRLTAATLFATLAVPVALAQENKPAEEPVPVIVGNPPPDHPFGKLKIGMKYDEVIVIVGQPTNQTSWCNGKQHIPFYFGDDKGRAEAYFKGMGKLDFNADVTMLPFKICKGGSPTSLIYVEYDPEATGELPKAPAEAAK